jgi:hypothetical protein
VQSTTSERNVPWVANSAPGRSVDGCIRSRAIFVIGIPTGGRGAYIPRSQFVEGLIVARVRLVVWVPPHVQTRSRDIIFFGACREL